jgi:hypothetical protein
MPRPCHSIQRYVGQIKDILLDATPRLVGQAWRVDDESHTTHEARRRFAAALREVRRRYGLETGQGDLTMKRFARMLGINGERPEERYRLYESAEREPPLWILAALRGVTGYSLDEIIAQLPAGRPFDEPRASVSRRRPARAPDLVAIPAAPIPRLVERRAEPREATPTNARKQRDQPARDG